MLKNERFEIIASLLDNGTSNINDLADKLGVSAMTVRRDLEELEQLGTVRKVHGGAILIKESPLQSSFNERVTENVKEKIEIAKEAVKIIQKDSTVFFDAGTTTLFTAHQIPDNFRFTAITNSLMTAMELCSRPMVNVIMLGGELHHSSFSAVNSIAIDQAQRFNADLALISTKAFSYPDGLFEQMLPLIEVKKNIVKCSKKVVLMIDYTKFENVSLCLSVPLMEIHSVITNKQVSPDYVTKIKNLGIDVTLV